MAIDFDVIEQEEHLANPARIIESNLKRDFFPSGQTLIIYGSDSYCRFGFRNYVNFPHTKYRLKNSWKVINFPAEDLLYGYNIKGYNKNSRTIHNTFDLNIIARKMNLGVIVKSHPNDIYDYRDYFSDQEEFFFHQDISARHIPVEFFLQSKEVKYTVGIPSSSLPFAEMDRLLVHMPKDRDLFRRKFLDQIPFLERLEIPVTYI